MMVIIEFNNLNQLGINKIITSEIILSERSDAPYQNGVMCLIKTALVKTK
jgi:hypothetical protein